MGKKKLTKLFIAFSLLTTTVTSIAAFQSARNPTTVRLFKRTHICPSTSKYSNTCPGFVVDHIIALHCGGLDKIENMQYQEIAESYKKDIWERKGCPAGGWR